MNVQSVDQLKSRYGLIWRGLKRPRDRELNIAGGEWIVFDITGGAVLAVQRDYFLTGLTRNTREGIWWLNASGCPKSANKNIFSSAIYDFVSKSLRPPVAGS